MEAHILGVMADTDAPADHVNAGSVRSVGAGVIVYLTNHVIAHMPSHRVRVGWHRRALGVRIGANSSIQLGCYLWFFGPGQLRRSGLSIGDRTIVNRGCCLDARGGLVIGSDTSISAEAVLLTASHRHDLPGFPLECHSTFVGDLVWVGMRAMIMPGVRIGRGAVVAAGAIVTRDVPPMAVVAGAPARIVGTRPQAGLEYRLSRLRAPLE